MTIASLVQARIFESWQYYQQELERVIAPLTNEQMRLRLVPGQRSLGEIAEHIVRARALWLPRALGEEENSAELRSMASWDDANDPPSTAAEVVHGLQVTWRLLTSGLSLGPADDTRDTIPDEEVTQLRTIWGLFEHDLHHGGELSFVLGAYGLPAPDM